MKAEISSAVARRKDEKVEGGGEEEKRSTADWARGERDRSEEKAERSVRILERNLLEIAVRVVARSGKLVGRENGLLRHRSLE
jgi:hypothetical protein